MTETKPKILILCEPGEKYNEERVKLEQRLGDLGNLEIVTSELNTIDAEDITSKLSKFSPDLVIPILHTDSKYNPNELAEKVLNQAWVENNNGNPMSLLFYDYAFDLKSNMLIGSFRKDRLAFSNPYSRFDSELINSLIDRREEVMINYSVNQIPDMLKLRGYERRGYDRTRTTLKNIEHIADEKNEEVVLTFNDGALLEFFYHGKKGYPKSSWQKKSGHLFSEESELPGRELYSIKTISKKISNILKSETFYTAALQGNLVRLIFDYKPTATTPGNWDELRFEFKNDFDCVTYTKGDKVTVFKEK
jgi:hypothetical protein